MPECFSGCIFFSKCIFLKYISKCIFAKCTRLACLLSFASLFVFIKVIFSFFFQVNVIVSWSWSLSSSVGFPDPLAFGLSSEAGTLSGRETVRQRDNQVLFRFL